ncbi:hypothetical protein TUBRATIS_20710 [Tubulinosema ratisbonensis]|uniref:Uncharacterized protein n=1 Tax=Tubulinosema ratisbonensis TaxID=291195 RepID=A0A437AK22_9MICR|nr:hypothetical protein TUBRATIS_20710 [Tubulinosema ratisbonensis]
MNKKLKKLIFKKYHKMLRSKKKDKKEQNEFLKTRKQIEQVEMLKIFEVINDSIFCILISIIILDITPIIEYTMFIKIYIIFKLLNGVFSLKKLTKYLKIRKFFYFLMLYDYVIKFFYLLVAIFINLSYVIKITKFYLNHLKQNYILIFYITTGGLLIYFIITCHFIFRYVQTIYLHSENLKKYLLHSFLSKLTILNFLYLISITYILYITRTEPDVFNYYLFSLCYFAILVIIPILFYKRMCLDKRFFLNILFNYCIKLFCIFLFNCGFLFAFVVLSLEQKETKLFTP